jgi:CDP-4-dehydro-6-deoxyglucose reductase, E1
MSKGGYNYPTAFTNWGPEEVDAIDRVVLSEQFTMAHETTAAEYDLAKYHGRKHAILVNSGSSANLIAVAAAVRHYGLNGIENAIVPALAWPTTYAPLVQHGFNLRVLDCDRTWNMDVQALKREIKQSTPSLVMVASILGNPADMTQIAQICAEKDIPLIEDNCESFGARMDGKLCGTFGVMSTLSFFYSHQISAIEGGAILTDDDDLAKLCRVMRNHGWTKGVEKPRSFQDEYRFIEWGYNVRPLEMHAAILQAQLKKADTMRTARQENYWAMVKSLESIKGVTIPLSYPGAECNPFGFAITVESQPMRDYLAGALRSASVDCRPVVGGSVQLHPYWRNGQIETPNADHIHHCGIMVGIQPYPNSRMTGVVRDVVERVI